MPKKDPKGHLYDKFPRRRATVECMACGEWQSQEFSKLLEVKQAVEVLSTCRHCGGKRMLFVGDTAVEAAPAKKGRPSTAGRPKLAQNVTPIGGVLAP